MHGNNQYPSDKSLSNVFDSFLPSPSPSSPSSSSTSASAPLTAASIPATASTAGTSASLRFGMERDPDASSPTIPSSPAPAYTTLPHRDVDFHMAPILEGKVGDVELETVDGKRFLVHRKLLESETVFFHIYYGFVPVWRLNAAGQGTNLTLPLHQHQQALTQPAPDQVQAQAPRASSARSFNNLLCLPKILANTLSRSSFLPPFAPALTSVSSSPPVPGQRAGAASRARLGAVPPYEESPPPPPPKDIVTAPTPTSSPYTWAVPETSLVLAAFLSLIYPRGCIVSQPEDMLTSLEITGRVVRAALGYQSAKALGLARDRLGAWIDTQPIETYAMASFFKFTDLVKLASIQAVKVPYHIWPEDAKVLMGRTARAKLLDHQAHRLTALREILAKPMEIDDHSSSCHGRKMTEEVWRLMTEQLTSSIGPESELLELLTVDLRGGHCGDCLVLLGRSIQRCLYEARDLPRSV